jgi:hydrogenase-4 component E
MTMTFLDPMLVAVMLLNFFLLGTSRIRAAIQVVALQGFTLAMMPLLVHERIGLRVVAVVLMTALLKAVVIPGMLLRAMRDLSIHREMEPLVSLTRTLLLGAAGTGMALALAGRLPLAEGHGTGLMVPCSLSTVLTGFLILTTRIKAITQVLGYLILENGIFIFGMLLLEPLPFLVEAGVLLDLFVAVFVMGIIINHINREFSSISTHRLAALRDEP